ncbi:hypothetical protein QTO34_020188 [Cnephaeus nilssonii]|uniref:Serpin domain-containing protein n=1 Tax=Cnephaeus nilssonii TaxID=3371016 RepID=A0AA40HY68_CNENI|nr:hypothetical protein QTO34_020188 [Eptesicus nilssonii]
MPVLLVLGLPAAGLGPTAHGLPGDTLDQKVTQGSETLVDNLRLASTTRLCLQLYKQSARKNPNKNVIFAETAMSVSTALAFLSLAARGRTLMDIHRGLKFNLTETSEMEIHQLPAPPERLGQPLGRLQLSVGNAMVISEQLQVLAMFRADATALHASEALSTDSRDSPAAQGLINADVCR